jgi:hypothetical protein
MADALAAAVVRLRDRAEEAHAELELAEPGLEEGEREGEMPSLQEHGSGEVLVDDGAAAAADPHEGPGEHREQSRPGEVEVLWQDEPGGPRYKHSLSLIGRLRLARKQRRARS